MWEIDQKISIEQNVTVLFVMQQEVCRSFVTVEVNGKILYLISELY
jgi:hypothetical protein